MTDATPTASGDFKDARPPRTPWPTWFPPVVIHTTVGARDGHPDYIAAKAGDAEAALAPVHDPGLESAVDGLRGFADKGATSPILPSVTALETTGFNAFLTRSRGCLRGGSAGEFLPARSCRPIGSGIRAPSRSIVS